jgi:hypothetical protein
MYVKNQQVNVFVARNAVTSAALITVRTIVLSACRKTLLDNE